MRMAHAPLRHVRAKPYVLTCRVDVGAAGALTVKTNGRKSGVVSVTRNSAGNWSLVFTSKVAELLAHSGSVLKASGQASTDGSFFELQAWDGQAKTATVVWKTMDGTFVAADPASGAQCRMRFELNDSDT